MTAVWSSFQGGIWEKEIDVRDFIQKNYTPYNGDESFLVGTTKKTDKVWKKCSELLEEELKKYAQGKRNSKWPIY